MTRSVDRPLTDAQERALISAVDAADSRDVGRTWGDGWSATRDHGRRSTVAVLARLGLVESQGEGIMAGWAVRPTDAGRELLASLE